MKFRSNYYGEIVTEHPYSVTWSICFYLADNCALVNIHGKMSKVVDPGVAPVVNKFCG